MDKHKKTNRIKTKISRFKLKHWQIIAIYLVMYDVVSIIMSYFMGLWIRFDCTFSKIPDNYFDAYIFFVPIYVIFTVLLYARLRLYNSIWRFASFSELTRISAATAISAVFHIIIMNLFICRMPVSYYIMGIIMQYAAAIFIRFSYRFVLLQRGLKEGVNEHISRVMIIGAGSAGQVILRDILREKKYKCIPVCVIDDNSNKWKRFIDGVPVVGGRDDILANVEKYRIDQILFAIPTAKAEDKHDILNICKETGCELKSLPGIYQLVNGEVSVSDMKNVDVEDLLGREPISVNSGEIFSYIREKVILVTGGGGSIGSELCRHIAGYSPKQLIIVDIYENNAYAIEQELKADYPQLNLVVLIGSVRDSRRIEGIFEKYRPDVVYHAAAHKHVPLMEGSPCEAVKNNVIGTYKTAYAALKYECQRFVLISTDKAVNPTNIMGASKRLCEMVIQSMNHISQNDMGESLAVLATHHNTDNDKLDLASRKRKTEFVAVRFGNVLGSNGSVIPLFKKQIERGGPVTVTHPDIIRYFMTIPEAVGLVIQAGVYAKGGEIFVLDMGESVKIDTLARNLIKLSGYVPDEDIKIVYTGLRPGEKLYEEKLMAEEGLTITPNKLIHVGRPIPFDENKFFADLKMLLKECYDNNPDIEKLVAGILPNYRVE